VANHRNREEGRYRRTPSNRILDSTVYLRGLSVHFCRSLHVKTRKRPRFILRITSSIVSTDRVRGSLSKTVCPLLPFASSENSETSTIYKPPDEYDYPNLIAMTSRGPVKRAAWKRRSDCKVLSVLAMQSIL
jgi:hypothetical protein